MKKTDQQQLQEYKEEVDRAKSERAEKVGERKALVDRLKRDYDTKPEQIGKRLKALEKQINDGDGTLSTVMEELREYFED